MSVTFSATQPIIGSVVRCFEHDATAVPFDTHNEAWGYLRAVQAGTAERPLTCAAACFEAYGSMCGSMLVNAAYPEVLPEVNMANTNARDVLQALGVDPEAEDWAGSFEASDLEARAMLALAFLSESPALESIAYANANGAKIIECGREAGYVQSRLAEIRALAALAAERGYSVGWC